MRKILFSGPLALAAAAVLATPAYAAPFVHEGGQIRYQIAQLDRQIDRAQARHLLSPIQANRLERQVSELRGLHASYSRGGLSPSEVRVLNQRIDTVQKHIQRQIAQGNRYR